jgi:hypothetical protein
MKERVRSAISIIALVALGVLTNLDLRGHSAPSAHASLAGVER